jgi:hypothetical protein
LPSKKALEGKIEACHKLNWVWATTFTSDVSFLEVVFFDLMALQKHKKKHVGHFCHPSEHGRVKTLLDFGLPCKFRTLREGISKIGQRLALT